MFPTIIAPLVALILAFPGFPGFSGLPGFKALRRNPPAAQDTLPPAWKIPSRLALENQFVVGALPRMSPAMTRLRVSGDPRQLRVGFDPDSGTVTSAVEFGQVAVNEPSRLSLSQFGPELSRRNFERLWAERTQTSLNTVLGSSGAPQTRGLSFQFPGGLIPRRVASFLGPGGPALNVSGSESIKLSGQSDWTNQQIGLLGQRRSLFPSLDMQQDLNIQLEGQLSDRVKVNLLQNSANQIPLANRIAINYKGDEDDLVQAFDLGNTNLSLPGTQYVSYSGRNEGLFGMKASSRFGPLDFTVLASKQEGKSERASYAGGSSRQNQSIRDYEYKRGVYFFLYDPNLGETRRIIEPSIRLYLDEHDITTQVNVIRGRGFVDPAVPDTSIVGNFKLLSPGADQDYEILNNIYNENYKIIRLRRTLAPAHVLAATYSYRQVVGDNQVLPDTIQVGGQDITDTDGQPTRILKLIRVPLDFLPGDERGFYQEFDPVSAPFVATRELELHNFYSLPGQRIDPKSFRISIRKGSDDPPRTTVQSGSGSTPIPYIEVAGLDNLNESNGRVPGHDGLMDGSSVTSPSGTFVDFDNGILFLPDPRPFAPRLGPNGKPFENAVDATILRGAKFTGVNNSETEPNPAIYDKRIVDQNDVKYWIDVDFTAAQASGEINLGRSNIIEGSDVVTVAGQAWVRNRDYRIDYDLGKVTLIKQPGSGDQVNVDYSYAPLFQQAGRTLLGSAFSYEGRDKHFGGAFLYESKGAQDLRPRLGEEPSRMLIGDLNTDWRFRPEWITRLVDRLPGVRTTAASEFNFTAEAGLSLPNPNTRNEVFIDDMEGVRDAVSLALDPLHWRLTSLPQRMVGGFPDSIEHFEKNVEVRWYSPLNAVKERDLKPSLSDAQGAQNTHQVLALSVPRRPRDWPDPAQPLWGGLTYVLDPVGIDLSKSQFIDLWIDDFNDHHVPGSAVPTPRVRGNHVKLHIDIGIVSEDQMPAPNVLPNDSLDTEDRNRDGQLTVTDENNEDTGIDQRLNGGDSARPPEAPQIAPDLTTANPGDPQGDDFAQPVTSGFNDIDPRKWDRINGTEGNKNVLPIPDSEDLNQNGLPDFQQHYFEYTIDLGDTSITNPYLVTDVLREFTNYANTGDPLPVDDGWRRFRIPITDSLRVKFGNADLAIARHVRLWLEDIHEPNAPAAANEEQRPFVMVGGLEIAGSRWQAVAVDSVARLAGTTLTLNSVNTVDNADDYVAPFDPGRTVNGNQEVVRREQSIALEFTNLQPGTTLEAFKTFSLDEDYSRYGNIRFFVSGFEIRDTYDPTVDSLFYFVRFASDEQGRNYYEYRRKVPPSSFRGSISWQDVELALNDLSVLKLNADFPKNDPIFYSAPGRTPDEHFIINGRPSFTRLRRISIGLVNDSTATRTFSSGQLWVDEIRSTDVAKDMGRAQRVTVGGRMANLLTYNLAYDGRDENFQSVGETRGSGNNVGNLSFSSTLDLHRFFEATGILLPVSFAQNVNNAQPRFTAGDDVVRTGVLAAASETHVTSRTLSTSYSRQWSDRANPFLKYTIGGITANMSMSQTRSRTPTTVDTTNSLNANVGYSVAPRPSWLAVPLGFLPHGAPKPGQPPGGPKLRLLPQRVFWNYAVSTSRARSYDRLRDSTGALQLRNATDGRTGIIEFGADSQPLDLLHHSISATRNLTLPEEQRETFGFVNLGRVVRWRQSLDSRYSFDRGLWLKPTVSWNTNFNQNNGPELSQDLSVRAITNSQSMTLSWDFPLDRLDATPVAAPNDTSRHVRGPALWRRWVSRLGPISTDAGLNNTSGYSRVVGTPTFLYLTGLSRDPGIVSDTTGHVVAQFGNVSSTTRDWHAGAHTRLDLGLGASVSTKVDFRRRESNTNDVESKSDLLGFPDLDLDYGKVADAIGLSRVLTNPKLRTVYRRSSTTDFSNSETPTAIVKSSQWQPLLGLTGDFKSGTRAEFRVERRVTQRESRTLGVSVNTDRNTDVNLSLSRSYTQGQKVVFLGKETTIRSSVTWRVSSAYSLRSGETIQIRNGQQDAPQFQVKEDRLSVNAGGSYGFSDNVTGNVDLGFGQNRDLQKAIVRRNVRVSVQAQFTF